MPKRFSVPSFSVPKMDSVKSVAVPRLDSLKAGASAIAGEKLEPVKKAIGDFKMPAISGIDNSQFQDMAGLMKDAGMPMTLNDLKQDLISKKGEFKMPTVGDLKDMAKNKVGDIAETAKNVKQNGIKGLVPQEVVDMKGQMEELGVSPTDMLKDYGLGEGSSITSLFKSKD